MVVSKEGNLVTYTQQPSNLGLAGDQFYVSTFGGTLRVETKEVGIPVGENGQQQFLDITKETSSEDLTDFIRGQLQHLHALKIKKQEGSPADTAC
jgi:hypothetical protein